MLNDSSIISECHHKVNAVVAYIKSEIVNIRGGKVSPSLVEGIMVETYEGTAKLKLMELATINMVGPLELLVTPFDYATLKDIEKALLAAPLNVMPRVEDKMIRLKLSPLSEEQRHKLLKLIGQKIEEGKVKLRLARDEARRKIKTGFEDKEFSEDQKFRLEKEIDRVVHEHSDKLDAMEEKKKKEIMEI